MLTTALDLAMGVDISCVPITGGATPRLFAERREERLRRAAFAPEAAAQEDDDFSHGGSR